ncbi:hypothetical protein MtrunA17_Chr4g0035091 [Medicago truncatula]|uniref:Uncharacterized protein n=1 Tax=Medicago truncatula TaxID=3880 RepID=A0A396I6Q6_MEDTR|nr:hypothetical protein MtrunA17_Chr4g0035091 [Medicago truncatula]
MKFVLWILVGRSLLFRDRKLASRFKFFGWLRVRCLLQSPEVEGRLVICFWSLVGRSLLIRDRELRIDRWWKLNWFRISAKLG